MKKNILLYIVIFVLGLTVGVLLQFHPQTMEAVQAGGLSTPDTGVLSEKIARSDETAALVSASPDMNDNAKLLDTAFRALKDIKAKDYASLSAMVHPSEGVIFVPYSTVNPSSNLHFTAQQIADLDGNQKDYVWGITDGEGKPIQMTMSEYFSRYVFNADYTQAPLIGVNQIIQSGNSLENVKDAFPDGQFVEFHFPGLQKDADGMDWCTLRLVFTEYKGEYRLRAVIHSEWTT